MRTFVEKTLDLAFGAAAVTREKAQEFVDELIRRGEAARDESGTLVEDILRRGQKQREEMQDLVQREVGEAMKHMNIASHDDLTNLQRRIEEMQVLVEGLRGASATPAPSDANAPAPPTEG